MSPELAKKVLEVLEGLVEEVADRAAEKILDRLRPEIGRPEPAAGVTLLDAKAVAEKLQVPVGAVYKLASSGRLTSVKVGGRLRFRLSDVLTFIEQGTRSDERVRELATSALADARRPRFPARTASASRRGTSRTGSARHGSGSPTKSPADTSLKVLTNHNPDAATGRKSG